jgi:multidrug efflux pump subunit AcrA (membrane-fusion protein)
MGNQIEKYPLILLVLILMCMVSSCHNSGNSTVTEIIARTPVTIVEPVIKDLDETVDLLAVTTYLKKNILRSSVTGIIENVSVTPGETAAKGKLLFKLKTLEASALQNSVPADTGLGFKGIIRIFSPVQGIISSITHYGGDFVQEGDELAVISDPKSLVFNLEVPFELTGYIDKNKECTIRLPDNKILKGRVRDRMPDMNVENQTVNYFIILSEPVQLPQNLIATAEIVKSVRKDAVVLPKSALLSDETQTDFWIMKLIDDTTAIKIPVVKGIENSDEVQIVEPVLTPADRILFSGNYGLPDTAAVTVTR